MASSKTPTAKVTAGGVAGAATVVIIWLAGLFGVEMTEVVAGSIVVLVSFGAAWLTRDRAAGKHEAD